MAGEGALCVCEDAAQGLRTPANVIKGSTDTMQEGATVSSFLWSELIFDIFISCFLACLSEKAYIYTNSAQCYGSRTTYPALNNAEVPIPL